LRLKLGQLLEVTGIGHHGGELFESVELVHGVSYKLAKMVTNIRQGGCRCNSGMPADEIFVGYLKAGLNYP
jgi:hypothetical protein